MWTVNHLWERLGRLQTDTVRSAMRPLYHRVAYSKHLSHIWIKHRHIISAAVTALQFYLLGFRLPSGSVFVSRCLYLFPFYGGQTRPSTNDRSTSDRLKTEQRLQSDQNKQVGANGPWELSRTGTKRNQKGLRYLSSSSSPQFTVTHRLQIEVSEGELKTKQKNK